MLVHIQITCKSGKNRSLDPQSQSFQFPESGMGTENLYSSKCPCDADDAGQGEPADAESGVLRTTESGSLLRLDSHINFSGDPDYFFP